MTRRQRKFTAEQVYAMVTDMMQEDGVRATARRLGVSASYLLRVADTGKLGTTIPAALGLRHVPGHYVRET